MSGEFGNLYDTSIGDQCTEIRIIVDLLDKPSPSSSLVIASSTAVSTIPTGGPGVTRSSSAVASPSGASSAAGNSTASGASSATGSSQAATASASSAGGSATRSGSGSSSPTASGAAPPAAEGDASLVSRRGTVLTVLLTALGAALVL